MTSSGQEDVFGYNKMLFDRLGNTLYERLRNEDELEFTFDRIFIVCNGIVSMKQQGLLSKELVYKIVDDLYKHNKLYKTDKNSERYAVS